MKKVSTLFDALRNEKFAIAIQDDYGVKYYGSEGQGKEWSDWANSLSTKTIDANNIPAGIIQGPYKNISEHSLKSLLTAFGNNISEIGNSYTDSKSYSYKSSVKMDNGARVPAVMDTPISHFTKSQYSSAVNYKGLAIRTQIKEGSFLFEARVNNYAFNFDNWMYNSTPSKAEIKSLRYRIDINVGRSSERRLGMKFKAALIERDGRHRVGYAQTLETKSLEDSLELKGIGQRIGGGARIGRRAARSMAMFDPKAWDGDGDGIVQEGTPFERPAIPGVNDKTTGGAVDVDAAKKAWKESQKTSGSSTPSRELSPARRAMREGSRSVGRQVLTNRKPADAGRKMPASKPIKRSGIASRTQADIDKEVSKQVLDMASEVLYKRSTTDELRSLVNGLGPDGGTELSREQENEINEIIDAFDNGELENMEDLISEISATLRKLPPRTQNQSGMRSRVGKAQMDRQVNGLASRSGRSKAKSKLKAVPGRDKVDEKDGSLWASLTPEQQDIVKSNTQAAYEGLQNYIKKDKYLSTWWDDFLRLPRKKGATDADGKPWSEQSRIAGEAFTSFEVALNGSLSVENADIASAEAALAAIRSTLSDVEIKKAEAKIATQKKKVERLQKVLDDLKTYDQMDRADDWSLLEHLHPEQRKKSFGTGLSKSEADLTVSPFADGKLPKGMKVGEPSTIFEEIGGLKRAKPRIIGEKGDAKLEDLANRILRPNPERARRRAVRKQKKAGRSGFNIEEENRRKGPGKIKKRINKAKRAVKRTFGKERNESKINDAIRKGQTVRIFERSADGKVSLGKETIDLFDQVINEAIRANGRGEFKGQPNANMLLGFLWENNGFNREATLISEDEAKALIDAGWHPIKRGVVKEGYADEYLTSPIRRITGSGGEAEGPGEYWANAVSSNWDGPQYWGNPTENNGMFAFLSPDYRVASREDRDKMSVQHSKISSVVKNLISTMPKGEAEKMDPADWMRELRSAFSKSLADGDPVWDTEIGQMWSSLMSAYESSSGPEKAKLWNVINFMSNQLERQDGWANYLPLILGYDALDTGDNTVRTGGPNAGKQFLIFNRQGLAVLNATINVKGINDILKEVGKK
jgi:hypothetical protein